LAALTRRTRLRGTIAGRIEVWPRNRAYMQRVRTWTFVLALSSFLQTPPLRADSDRCAICGGEFGETIYAITDRVTGDTLQICRTCATWPDRCFICGLPVRKDFLALPDGRFLCARDARTAVLDPAEARRICRQVHDDLDRLFSRFLSFPDTNVDVAIVDRVNLLAFKVPGNDFICPNLLGYIQPRRIRGQVRYEMSLLSALPEVEFKAVCAHEYGHAWVFANVPAARRRTLGQDAHEGFCELLAFLLMDAEQAEAQKRAILENHYTRGQIQLFVEAERRYGFNDIVDWMKYGVDAQLDPDDPGRVRNVSLPHHLPPQNLAPTEYAVRLPREPDRLVLRGISLDPHLPLAFINDQTLTVGESAPVRLGNGRVRVRCVAIDDHSVRVRVLDSGEERELRLRSRD
jgi:hypothetical protein